MELEEPFTFTEKDFGDGSIQLLAIDGKVFDFHGNLVTPKYQPIKVDYSVPDPIP